MVSNYKLVKLKELIHLHYGSALKAEDRNGGNIPVYGSNGIVGYHNKPLINSSTVIIGRKGSVGAANYSEEPCWAIDTSYYTEVKSGSRLFLKYFFYFAQSVDISLISQKGVKPGVNRNDYLALEIPLPSLGEQQTIVYKLERLFEKIVKSIHLLEENMRNAHYLMTSVLNQVFEGNSWEIYPFGKIVENLDGKRKPIKSSTRVQGDYPYYGASGIIDYVEDYIYEGENLLISEDGANLVMRTYPIAFIAVGKYWVNNHAHVVNAKQEITSNRFLELYFAHKDISDFITGSAQPKLSQKKLNEIPIPLPDLTTQERIIEYVDKVEKRQRALYTKYQERLIALKALKASVLDAAFKGELSNTSWETLSEQSALVD